MQIKLTDYKTETRTVDEGTCDLCYYSYDCEDQVFTFSYGDDKRPRSKRIEITKNPWSVEPLLENIPAFAGWIKEQNFPEGLRLHQALFFDLVTAFKEGRSLTPESFEDRGNRVYFLRPIN